MTSSWAVRLPLLLAGVLISTVFAERASAETAAEVAARWRLLGQWKPDCSSPTSRANTVFNFVARDGKLYQDRDMGDWQDSSLVMEATVQPDGSIELTTVLGGAAGTRTTVLRMQDEAHFLVWSNRAAGTQPYTIKDGRFANGSNVRPLLMRCGAEEKLS